MSTHEPAFVLTSKALAYLKCYPYEGARKCGACYRSQSTCTVAPCPTRLDACEV